MSSRFQIDPRTSWAARLEAAGLAPVRSLTSSSRQGSWDETEQLLWNRLLPLQEESGTFRTAGDSGHGSGPSLEEIVDAAVAVGSGSLTLRLPLTGVGTTEAAGERLEWRIESAYPQRGLTSVTFLTGAQALSLQLHLPAFAESIQLLRNGSPVPLQWEGRFLELPGPWKAGENVTLRFGIPFRIFREGVNPLTGRPVERAYPDAPEVKSAYVYHGARMLLPLRDGDEPVNEIAVGVRKDGVVLLWPDDDLLDSPFARPGDSFRGGGAEGVRLAAAALWSSTTASPWQPSPSTFRFRPYETAFDRGA